MLQNNFSQTDYGYQQSKLLVKMASVWKYFNTVQMKKTGEYDSKGLLLWLWLIIICLFISQLLDCRKPEEGIYVSRKLDVFPLNMHISPRL